MYSYVITNIYFSKLWQNIPSPSNINLAKTPLPEVKKILRGTWQLHYLRGGFCGVCEYECYKEFYTFGVNDHIKWTIDKAVMSDTTITWIKQEWQEIKYR